MTQCYYFDFRWNRPDNHDHSNEMLGLIAHLKLVSSKWQFQRERGESKGVIHYQGFLCTKAKARIDTMQNEWTNIFPGIRLGICSTAGKEALRAYTMKTETRIDGPWNNDKSKKYKGEDLPKDWYPWQEDMKDIMLTDMLSKQDRKILWIVDPEGGQGKSKLAKWFIWQHKATLIQYGKFSDMVHICAKAVKDGRTNLFIFNLTKAKPVDLSHQDMYTLMENLKDGMLVSGKYDAESLEPFDTACVTVFANHAPDFRIVFRNRFDIMTIQDNKLIPF